MWKLLPLKFLLSLVSILIFFYVILYSSFIGLPTVNEIFSWEFVRISKFVSYLSTYSLFFYFFFRLFGIFPWKIPLLKGFLNRNLAPDLSGKWEASISYRDSENGILYKKLNFNIKMSFFDFKMTMTSDDNYSSSSVVMSDIRRDSINEGYILYYVFEAFVPNPLPSDTQHFQGSAKVYITPSDGDSLTMKGSYWTNRAWNQGKQTAGYLDFKKV